MLRKEEVEHIALLARIGLRADEMAPYQKNLSSMLDFFRVLEKLDTGSVEPIGHITDRVAEARADKSRPVSSEVREKILDNVPLKHKDFVKVRSVF